MSHQNRERRRSQHAALPSAGAAAKPVDGGRPAPFKAGSGVRPSFQATSSSPPHSSPAGSRASRSSASFPQVRPSTSMPRAQLPHDWTPRKAFDAARANLKRGALAEASAFAQQACDGEPDCLEFRALHAWLRVQRGELRTEADATEILAILTRALREQRHNLEIRVYRARVLQRLGRAEEAARDFSVVASMDPKHLEAIREVRLYQARSQQKPSALSGILARVIARDDDDD